jgi:hypothetical protein
MQCINKAFYWEKIRENVILKTGKEMDCEKGREI